MRSIKVILGIIILVMIAIGAYQNRAFLLETESLSIHLMTLKYETPKMQIGLMFSASFLIGMLLAYFFSLLSRYKSSRMIKSLNQNNNDQTKKIAELEARLTAQQSATSLPPGVKPAGFK